MVTVPCKFYRPTGHASENCGTKYPEKRGKTVFVKPRHLEMVNDMSQRFEAYLESARDILDSGEAKISRLRDDSFDGSLKGKGSLAGGGKN